MAQKLTGEARPAKAACGDSVIEVSPDESVLILIKHCRDMKQQETRLRLVTLLLLLSCMGLILFNIIDLRISAPREPGSAAAQSPAYSKQETVCPGDPPNSPTTSQRLPILLRSLPANNNSDQQYLKWKFMFGGNYINKEKHAIVIPQTGIYFIYVRMDLSYTCVRDEKLIHFSAELHTWNENYNKTLKVMNMWHGVHCSSEEPGRTVFDGQLFDLVEGTHISVWIHKGYRLIRKSSFGAYLT